MVMGALERLDPPRVLGDLTLLAALGEGGMATVYLAGVGSGPLARMCAVKLLRANLPDHDYRTRFLDEARLVVRLHHNNIVDVRAAGEIDGQLYIAMEAIEGRDLADVWDRCAEVGRAFPVPLAVHVCREVLRGLHYAHTFPGLGLVHRDVSPSNVLIDWAGAVRLADFGLATSSLKASLTLPGVVFGKVGYMSPEQARHEPLDGRADVYAVAVILWELLTGRPLRAPDHMTTDTVSQFVADAPSSKSRRVDTGLDEIVIKGLSRDRADRWPNAHAMMLALNQWLADHAPDMGQERVAEFMRKLFGDAREVETTSRAELLRELTGGHQAAGERAESDAHTQPRDSRSARSGPVASTLDAKELIEPGVVIADRYRVLSRLGRGGMGYVYLGEHVTVGRSVAIKVLTFDWSRTPAVAERFRAEARAASAAGHPNIVEVFDAGELGDGRLYLVMEFLTGRNLFEEVQAVGPLPVARACHIVRDVARAIRAAHEVGIIHRDLKPDNVMLVNRGRDEGEVVKVLDFGISSSATRPDNAERLTTVGQALGTPEYMAPEQAKGHEPDERFDIYALGAMFFELLAGDPPFHGPNVFEVVSRKTSERAPTIGDHREGLPPAVISLVDDCLAIDPKARPQTAQLFLARIEDVLRSLPRPGASNTELPVSPVSPLSPLSPLSPGESAVAEPARAGHPSATIIKAAGAASSLEPAGGSPGPLRVAATPLEPAVTPTASRFPPIMIVLAVGVVVAVLLGVWAMDFGRAGTDDNPQLAAASDGLPDTNTPSDPDAGRAEAGETQGHTASNLPDGPDTQPGNLEATGQGESGESRETGEPGETEDAGESEDAGETGELPEEETGSASPDPKTPTIAKYKTTECLELREATDKAAKAWDWKGVLRMTKDRKCWAGNKTDRTRFEVQAYKELGRWDDCVRAGKGTSGQVKGWVNICQSKL